MSTRSSIKLLIPGLFLLVLGLGNIGVGIYKAEEYREVLADLEAAESTPALINVSPLRRVQLAKQTKTRLYQRRTKARQRQDLYRLVTFGGKVFIAMSLFFLAAAGVIHYLQPIRRSNLPSGSPSSA